MYSAMLEARLLEEHLRRSLQAKRQPSIRGEEACRAAAAACLQAGDLISDSSESAAADLLFGVSMRDLVRGSHSSGAKQNAPSVPNRLPRETNTGRQLQTALGAAHALKLQRARHLLLVVCTAERDPRLWRDVLGQAGTRDLPVVFLLTPPSKVAARMAMTAGQISDRARGWGVPGIPVDASDGVALYRVLSEATLRARSGDGPTLIEGIRWQIPGGRTRQAADPLLAMTLALLARRVSTTRWQASVARRFRARLAAL